MLDRITPEREEDSTQVQRSSLIEDGRRRLVQRSPRIISTSWERVTEQAVGVRRLWSVSPARVSFVVVVILPTLLAAFYSIAWGSNRYLSEFRASVQTVEPIKGGGLADLFGFSGMSQAGNDSQAVVQYLQSHQAIEDLEKSVNLRQMYGEPSIDWFSRLKQNAQIEDFTRYWNRMVTATYEGSTGTIIVSVSSFTPGDAQDIATRLLKQAEGLVNTLSARAREDSVKFAEQEVTKAEQRLTDVRQRARALQDSESMLDPQKSAEATLALTAKLREEIARRNADLATQRSQMSDSAPSVQATKNTIAGLESELARIESQVTSRSNGSVATNGKPLSSVLGAFEQVNDERTFAEKAYLSALTSLETARMEANRQQVYLATIVTPGLPQEPAYPKPFRMISLTFLVAGALWLIGLLGVYSVREHM